MSSLLGASGEPISFYSEPFKPVLAVLHSGQSLIANDRGGYWDNPLLIIPTGANTVGFMVPLRYAAEGEKMQPLAHPHALHVTHNIQPQVVKLYEQALAEQRMQKAGLTAARAMPVIEPAVQGGRIT